MQNSIQKLENLVELYNSKTINREEFESLKKEIFTSKIMVVSTIQEPISKSVTGTIDKEKNKPKIAYSDANNKRSEQKAFAFVTLFVIIVCLGGFIAFVNSNSINANNSNSTQISSPPSSTNVNQSTSDGNTCIICGRKFYGLGYEEVSDGVWQQSTSNQYFICSAECGLKHTRKINNLTQQAVQEHGVSNGNVCSSCGLGRYVNGFCSRCGAASREVVEEHNSRMPVCGLCKGTGIEMPMGANTGGETGRICPACNGTGHSSY